MTGFIGADVEQLGRLASLFEGKAQALQQMIGVSSASLMVAEWVGADIDRIRSEWNRDAKTSMLKIAGQLSFLARELRKQAEDQGTASAAPAGNLPWRGPVVSTSCIIDKVRELPSDDLMRIEQVVGSDGVIRYVVYINGTMGDIKDLTVKNYFRMHGWAWNLDASFGVKTPAEILITETLKRRLADDGESGAELMVVGYSQGGMVAQTLADREGFNIKEVMTIGSPPVAQMNGYHGAHVTRLLHNGDQATNLTDIARIALLRPVADIAIHLLAQGDLLHGQVNEFRAGTPGFFAHGLDSGDYRWLADQYDRSNDPSFVESRERQAVFLGGEVTATTQIPERSN